MNDKQLEVQLANLLAFNPNALLRANQIHDLARQEESCHVMEVLDFVGREDEVDIEVEGISNPYSMDEVNIQEIVGGYLIKMDGFNGVRNYYAFLEAYYGMFFYIDYVDGLATIVDPIEAKSIIRKLENIC